MIIEQQSDGEKEFAESLASLRSGQATDDAPAPAPELSDKVVPEVAEPALSNDAKQAPVAAASDEPPADELSKTQAELHKLKSEIGRVNALNRRYNETRAEAEKLRSENEALKQRSVVAQPEQISEAEKKLAEVAEQVKDFPELSGLVAAVGAALKQSDSKVAEIAKNAAAQAVQPLDELRRETEQRRIQEATAAAEAAMGVFQSSYPTAVEVIRSQEFSAWMARAPKQVQDAFVHGTTPDEALAVMDAYDAHLRRSGKTAIASTSQPAIAPAKPSNPQSRLQSAAGLPSRASGAKGGMPPEDDFEASLAYWRRKAVAA